MTSSTRWLYGALAAAALLFAGPSAAQTLTVSLTGALSGCSDSSANGPVNAVFSLSPGGGEVVVDLGGNAGSFPLNESIDGLYEAISQAGGSIAIHISGELLGPPSLCTFNGTLSISILGNGISPDAPGNLATTSAVIDGFVRASLPAISNRVRAVFAGNGSGLLRSHDGVTLQGMAAGSGDRLPIGAWAGYSYTDSENDFVTTAFDSKRHNVSVGLDTMPMENWVVGVSVALERTSVTTRFNSGEQDITGISVVPYVGYLVSDWLSLDAAFGVSTVQTDQFRTSGGARITSDVESTRVFGNLNATGTWTFGSVLASSRVGLLYATQDDDDFTESNGNTFQDTRTTVGRFLLGGELAYAAGRYEPYVGATFEHDFTRTGVNFAPGVARPESDDNDVLFAAGLRYYGSDDLSGSIEYTTLIGRKNLDEDTISANLRWQF